MKKPLFLLITMVFLSIYTPAFAQLKLDKYQEKIEITPGQTYTGFITVENTSKEQVTAKTSIDDIVFLPPYDGNREYKPAGSTPYSISEWLTVSPEIFNVPAMGRQKINYTLIIPQEAKGGYYGTIFIEKVRTDVSTGIGVTLRIGCTLSLITKDSVRSLKIEDVSLTQKGIKGKIVNTGNVILNSNYAYNLIDPKGKIFDRGNSAKSILVPPGEKAPFSINLNTKKLKEGNYSLVFDFKLASGEALSGELELSKDKSGNLNIVKVKD